ncbi:gas vesicle protein GvpA [Natrinema saccharevitans]|uniref:Gas vesicle protein GvpA n=1 Tax=Natrinema saccharevitans TaxID=301967 RepID=A0A1S8AVK9_9EURY|nr:gas vesicle protein [Natrinema saccharevitans]OLZ40705.1 gas vesicle protein GvpA [Natrinema saccharevitans]
MRPRKDDESLVDVLDVLLRDGAILRADVIVSIAEIPLIGIKLTAAIAGMETMNEYGLFEDWDAHRRMAAAGRCTHYDGPPANAADDGAETGLENDGSDAAFDGLEELGIGSSHAGVDETGKTNGEE